MPDEELIDIKFRLYDGSDIGPFRYSSASTVDMLKQRIVSDWPKGGVIIMHVVVQPSLAKTKTEYSLQLDDNINGLLEL
ncbi:hypothetical protein CUMW_170740 [Citrus unshiu]|uniref:UBL3-like ubiquitin domain-containing protein n=1 Tax=Citrus unshiu TaxID=55188 RepID=A0A2H5PV91_CITUN|nr:hypothetical protein CUMW_170740 [Citrus unshiu]